jgi:hypothetical protein
MARQQWKRSPDITRKLGLSQPRIIEVLLDYHLDQYHLSRHTHIQTVILCTHCTNNNYTGTFLPLEDVVYIGIKTSQAILCITFSTYFLKKDSVHKFLLTPPPPPFSIQTLHFSVPVFSRQRYTSQTNYNIPSTNIFSYNTSLYETIALRSRKIVTVNVHVYNIITCLKIH